MQKPERSNEPILRKQIYRQMDERLDNDGQRKQVNELR